MLVCDAVAVTFVQWPRHATFVCPLCTTMHALAGVCAAGQTACEKEAGFVFVSRTEECVRGSEKSV